MIRVLIVCDRALVRAGLEHVLEERPDMSLAGAAENAEVAASSLEQAAPAPDVVLVDLSLPLAEGLSATAQIARAASPSRVVVLGGLGDAPQARRTMDAGASGFLWKGADVAELCRAITTVHAGETYLSPEAANGNGVHGESGSPDPAASPSASNGNSSSRSRSNGAGGGAAAGHASNGQNGIDVSAAVASLSKREFEVMCFLATGMTNREIAQELGISVKTIDTHRGHVLKKLHLRNNSDITRFAIRHSLVGL